MARARGILAGVGLVTAGVAAAVGAPAQVTAPVVVGDAIAAPLTATPGNAMRGREIVADRRIGLCLLCHSGPFPEEAFQGDLAPSLAGAGKRLNPGQLRLRLVDSRRLNPASLMPSYHRADGLQRVGSAWQGRPILDAQQIEDVVAFLQTLKD